MQTKTLEVTYHAQPQFERLSAAEQDKLDRILTDPELRQAGPHRLSNSGHWITPIGSKRVLWKIADDGHPIVLSVVEAADAA
jgi:hypothetical protein